MTAYVGSIVLVAEDQGVRLTRAQLLGLAVGIAGLVLAGPPFGAVGAAVASTIGYAVLLVAIMHGLRVSPSVLIPTGGAFQMGIRRLFMWDGDT